MGLAVEVVEQLGAKVFEAFGGVGKGLFETITPDKDMPDNLALIGLEGAFTLCIEGSGYVDGIGTSLGNGISKELKDIVVPKSPVVYSAVLSLSPLAIRTQMQPTTADHRHKPYNSPLSQSLIGSNSLK